MTTPRKLLDHVTAPAPRYILRLSLLERIFREKLPAHGYSAIEFGPGLGDVSSYLVHNSPCTDLTLVDFSEQTLDMLRQRFKASSSIEYLCDDLENLSTEKTFDIVLAFEVLEHINEDARAFAKLSALTRPEGCFIMSVPAYRKKWQKQDVHAGHIRRYERLELQEKLTNAGFGNVEIIDYGFPLTALMYPLRQTLYKPDTDSSLEDRSKKSGTSRPLFSRIPLWLLRPFYFPFVRLQNIFINKDLGDGFIAIARKT